MPIDPELAQAIWPPIPNDLDDIPLTRERQAAMAASAPPPRWYSSEDVEWRDRLVPAREGGREIPVRLYRNTRVARPGGALVYLHGGAFVFGGLDSDHERCAYYAQSGLGDVISVAYRLAPEHRCPAPLEDVLDVWRWIHDPRVDLDLDRERIAIGGASAGGCLAASASIALRDSGGPQPAGQLLIYPVLSDADSAASLREFETYEPWDGRRSRQMWSIFLNGADGASRDACVPERARDLSGLAETFIATADEDPLRDDALDFTRRLAESGVLVEHHHYEGTYHGFDAVAPAARISQLALADQADFLRRVFGSVTD